MLSGGSSRRRAPAGLRIRPPVFGDQFRLQCQADRTASGSSCERSPMISRLYLGLIVFVGCSDSTQSGSRAEPPAQADALAITQSELVILGTITSMEPSSRPRSTRNWL